MAKKTDLDFEFEDEEEKEITTNNDPEYGSENWEQFVMSKFLPDELYNEEYPTLNGLRRVANLLLGPFIRSGPTMISANLPMSAYCIYEIENEAGIIYSAAADGHIDNISKEYSIYPTTMAESRAEARAYRKLLMLSTASSDEIKGKETVFNSVLKTEGYSQDDPISDQQITIIESKCKKLKIDLPKFLKQFDLDNISKAKKSDSKEMGKKITQYQKDGVPEELKN